MSNQLQVSGEAKIRAIQGPVVANSGVITALDGDASEYVRGDGTLADFPTSTGGGSSVSYYLNTSVSQGTIGGVAYKQLSKTPISGAGTDVTISANGYIASYITDANDPALLEVPAGNFNCEFYFSVNSNSHNPYVYAELYKYDGTTFTLLGSNVAIPQYLTNGTTLSAYYFAIPVATSVLTVTDRIAIRIYVNVDGRTVTLHTENNHLCQVVTTFSKGLISLNNLTRQNQFFQTGTSGTDFNISSTTATHTFNIPDASATNRGLITTGTQTIAGSKTFSSTILLNSVYIDGLSYLKHQASSGGGIAGYTVFNALANGIIEYIFPTLFKSVLDFNDGGDYTYTFPAATGTIALTSSLASYVPYTGAIANVDLGGNDLSGYYINGTQLTAKKVGSTGGALFIETGSGYVVGGVSGIAMASGSANNLSLFFIDATATNTKNAILNFGSLTNNTNRTYTLPDASGTIALTSSLASYVPYTGATASVNIGNNLLSSASIQLNGDNTSNFGYLGFKQYAGGSSGFNGYTSIFAQGTNSINIAFSATGGSKTISFLSDLISSSTTRSYSLPDADGTIALTSSLSSYLPLAGGTLTGALNGTSAVFSSTVQASAYRLTGMTGGSGALYWTSDRVTLANYNATGVVQIEANGGTSVATFGGATYNNDFVGTLRNTTSAYFATTSGNVGIGNVSASYKLDVSGTGRFTDKITSTFGSNGTMIENTSSTTNYLNIIRTTSTGSNLTMWIENSTGGNRAVGSLAYAGGLCTYTSTALQFGTDNNIRMTITSAGNVLMNTTTSSTSGGFTNSTLLIKQVANGTDGGGLQIESNTTDNVAFFGFDSVNSVFKIGLSYRASGSYQPLSFSTGGAERMRIGENGNIGIGVTNSSVTRLLVKGENTSSSNFAFVATNSAATNLLVVRNDGFFLTGTATNSPFNNTTVSVANTVVFSDGGLGKSTASSKRFKENINEWNGNGLDTILALKPKTFTYKADYYKYSNIVMLGLIAEDVAEVSEYLADFENEDRTGQVENVRYANIVVPLIKAIQEMNTKLDAQNQTIQNLQEQINAK